MSTEPSSRTVLVVDDEPEIRKLVGAMLSREGFTVLVSDSGDPAVRTFTKHSGRIDLLLADVVSPGMSGPMLVDQLLELQPDLHVLFMSGYEGSQVIQRYVLERGFSLLIKPFTREQLVTRVNEALIGSAVSGAA